VKLDSSHPSVKCEGHFQVKAGYLYSLSEGWSDELCPDFDLSQMDLSVRLFPAVVNGALTLGGAQVTVQLAPQGVQSELIDVLFDATDKAETTIASKIHDRLLEPQTRSDLGKVLTAVLKSKFKDLGRVVSAQIVGNDWVVRYESTAH
jgi:hypothetical protein